MRRLRSAAASPFAAGTPLRNLPEGGERLVGKQLCLGEVIGDEMQPRQGILARVFSEWRAMRMHFRKLS